VSYAVSLSPPLGQQMLFGPRLKSICPNQHHTHSDATACQLPEQYGRHALTFAKLLIPK
jgi:hypothetical protein